MAANHELAEAFSPCETFALAVLEVWDCTLPDNDGSHDHSHLMRVWRMVLKIAATEATADLELLAAATLLHDCVAVEKNAPNRAMASRLSAEAARRVLGRLGWPEERVAAVAHAIEAHSFSAGIEPRSLEAAILRDADRLDSLGALGIARTFYIAGRMESRLYDSADPFGGGRDLDDKSFALDHFAAKLLKLEAGLLTDQGRQIGRERTALMRSFIDDMRREIFFQ
ncbi:MAG TPA: HD domain-containing protein [Rhizobiaceae bacterium]|nr:HD domain-containing protein [Rhizobiaceae bacterium]